MTPFGIVSRALDWAVGAFVWQAVQKPPNWSTAAEWSAGALSFALLLAWQIWRQTSPARYAWKTDSEPLGPPEPVNVPPAVRWEQIGHCFWGATLPNGWMATVSRCYDGRTFSAGAAGPRGEARGDGVRRTLEDAKKRALEFAGYQE
jgi:hypothetical protein